MQPPLQYAVYSKLRSFMTGSEVDKAGIFVDVIYTVWWNSSKFFNQKIMVQNFPRIVLFTVFLTVVLEVSKVLLLLAIYVYYRDDCVCMR